MRALRPGRVGTKEASPDRIQINKNIVQPPIDLAAHAAASDPHPGYLLESAAATTYEALGAVATHEAAGDPHPQYLTSAEGNAAYEPLGEGATQAAAAVATHEGGYHDAPTAPAAVTLGGSPHTYTNSGDRPVQVIVEGGTVSAIELSHNGTDWIDIGVTAGAVVAATGYRVRVTYSSDPTVTAVEH